MDTPLLPPGYDGRGELPKIYNFTAYMAAGRRRDGALFIDLEERQFLRRPEAMRLANEGVDGGELDGVARPPFGWDPRFSIEDQVEGGVGFMGDEDDDESETKVASKRALPLVSTGAKPGSFQTSLERFMSAAKPSPSLKGP
jgi:hypothetical protein